MENPKVFISYSWNDQPHQQLVKHWADRLVADGIDVILDIYDLREGDDKYAFMESMITDATVTHILVICEKNYADKADARKAGVGTESQIISKEVYERVKQSKFIPIVCELSDNGEPFVPTFFKSRIWIDFSSAEAVNENWEQLIRLLFGKPQYIKPKLGPVPAYIKNEASAPANEAQAKFNSLKQAVLQNKTGIRHYRREFIDSSIRYADDLRVRKQPITDSLGNKILEDCGKLKAIRDLVSDWIILEGETQNLEELSEAIIDFLERLVELKFRPAEVTQWNDSWFEAHAVFVYETFLYVIAALLKVGAFSVLRNIYSSHYLLPESVYGEEKFKKFDCFFGSSNALQTILAPEGKQLYAPAAELVKRQANREDIPFSDVMQAELLTLLMSFVISGTRWYPQTLHYAQYGRSFPFFVRSAQHKNFKKLSIITGIETADGLRRVAREGAGRLGVNQWHNFYLDGGFELYMNLEKLDTLT